MSALVGCAALHTLKMSWCLGVRDVSALAGCARGTAHARHRILSWSDGREGAGVARGVAFLRLCVGRGGDTYRLVCIMRFTYAPIHLSPYPATVEKSATKWVNFRLH